MRALYSSIVLSLAYVLFSTRTAAYEGSSRREASADAGILTGILTKPPTLIRNVTAAYPEPAKTEGRTGSVRMMLTLDAAGKVTRADVVSSAGSDFDSAALEAVRQFEFSPAEVDGTPAPVQLEYLYHFTLSAPSPPVPSKGAPSARLLGVVVARGRNQSVPFASIAVGCGAQSFETTSDAEGRWSLDILAGRCSVKAVAPEFENFQTQETLEPDEQREVKYFLRPKAVGYETVVRGAREKKEVVRRTLERQELQRVPGTLGDPVRVVQNFPGVARPAFIGGQLIVRGASPDQTLTYFDGVEVPLLYHLGGGPSVVNAEFLDRIDFYPGGFGARYGRAIGGVVDVATRKGAADSLHGSVKVDLIDSSVFVEAPVAKGVSVAAAARRSYVDLLLPLVLPRDPEGGSLLIVPRYWDYQVRADIGGSRSPSVTSGRNTYSVMAFGSDDLLKVVASGGGRNRDVTVDVHTLFHRVRGEWMHRAGRWTNVLAPFVGYDLGDFKFGAITARADAYDFGIREDLRFEANESVTWRGGLDVVFEHAVGKAELPVLNFQYVPFPGAEPLAQSQTFTRTYNSSNFGVYTEADFKVGPVTLTPGIRASRARLRGRSLDALEPRFWVRHQLSKTTQLKGSVGLYTQPPGADEMESEPFGNPRLSIERATQTSLGIEQKITDDIDIDVTAFYNRRRDVIVNPGRVNVQNDGSVLREQFSNDGLNRAYGVEVLLRHQVTENFFGWLAYTLNRADARRRDANDPYRVTSYDQTHILTLIASRRLPKNFELGGRFRYVTGRPTTRLQHFADLYNADSNQYSGTYGEPFSSRLRPFHQLDLRLDWHHLFSRWTLTLYLDVQNVYNAQNIEAVMPGDYRFRSTLEVPGIPVLPVLGVKGAF